MIWRAANIRNKVENISKFFVAIMILRLDVMSYLLRWFPTSGNEMLRMQISYNILMLLFHRSIDCSSISLWLCDCMKIVSVNIKRSKRVKLQQRNIPKWNIYFKSGQKQKLILHKTEYTQSQHEQLSSITCADCWPEDLACVRQQIFIHLDFLLQTHKNVSYCERGDT